MGYVYPEIISGFTACSASRAAASSSCLVTVIFLIKLSLPPTARSTAKQ